MTRAFLVLGLLAGSRLAAAARDESPTAVFERRIKPIFTSPNPGSCVECHLAGVDLKDYIRPSSDETFLSLRDQGLVDLERPERSRILAFMEMGAGEPGAPSLIPSEVRRQEYAAFRAWIAAAAADPRLRSAPRLGPEALARSRAPTAVIRHARRDRVLASFERHVWAQRFRCASCHSPEAAEAKNLVAKQGTDDFLWVRPEGAEATMGYLLKNDLVDLQRPEDSLLLRKPTGQVKHGGGKKMEVGDLGYKEVRRWIEDYARTVAGGYRKADELPVESGPAYVGSDIWLKITDTPAGWGDKLLQVSVHAARPDGTWTREPVATSDRAVWGKGRAWQNSLALLVPSAASSGQRAAALAPGRYLLRVFVDQEGKLARDWKRSLGAEDRAAEIVVDTSWPAGYGKMTVVAAPQPSAGAASKSDRTL